MKNESRFRFSHVILFLFLVGVGGFIGYLMIDTWISSGFNLLFLLYIPMFSLVVILPIWSAVGLVIEDIKNIKNGESTSLYADENKK